MRINLAMWRKASWQLVKIDDKKEWDALDVVSKWLIATRSAVTLVTVYSCVIAGLLAWRDDLFTWVAFPILTVGLFVAHGTNNLLNDYTDYARGVDKGNYFRAQYGPQPLEHGLLTRRQLLTYAAVTGLVAVAAGVALILYRGGLTPLLMVAGAVFVLFYTFPLKYIGLGEVILLIVWGPLMVGGGYYVLTDSWSWLVVLAGLAYSLGVCAALMGKHIDKLDMDAAKHIRTLPVLLGERPARTVTLGLIVLQYAVVIALVIARFFSPLLLVVLFSLPFFFRVVVPMYRHSRPAEPPEGYPAGVWPLWYVAAGFAFSRRFGGLYLLGLILDVVLKLLILPLFR